MIAGSDVLAFFEAEYHQETQVISPSVSCVFGSSLAASFEIFNVMLCLFLLQSLY